MIALVLVFIGTFTDFKKCWVPVFTLPRRKRQSNGVGVTSKSSCSWSVAKYPTPHHCFFGPFFLCGSKVWLPVRQPCWPVKPRVMLVLVSHHLVFKVTDVIGSWKWVNYSYYCNWLRNCLGFDFSTDIWNLLYYKAIIVTSLVGN